MTNQSPRMFRIETFAGDFIDHVCAKAYREQKTRHVAVFFEFNGVNLDTTMADDADGLAKLYSKILTEQAEAYRKTPEYAALQERERKAQEEHAAYLAKPQRFPIAAVISAYTGRVVCDFGEMWKVLDYMTGESLFNHQAPRAAEWARPHLLAQVPGLANLDIKSLVDALSGVNSNDRRWAVVNDWLEAEMTANALPKTVTLRHVPGFTAMDPSAELSAMLTPEN